MRKISLNAQLIMQLLFLSLLGFSTEVDYFCLNIKSKYVYSPWSLPLLPFSCFGHLFQNLISVFLIESKHIGHEHAVTTSVGISTGTCTNTPCAVQISFCFLCRKWFLLQILATETESVAVYVEAFIHLTTVWSVGNSTDDSMCGAAWIWNSCPAICRKILSGILT